jgi:hypothetical protein
MSLAIDAYNTTPQDSLDGKSPYEVVHNRGIQDPGDVHEQPCVPLTKTQRRMMVRRFGKEGRSRRRAFKLALQRDWESHVAPAYDQENDRPGAEPLVEEEIAYDHFMIERLNRFDSDLEDKKADFLDDLFHAALPGNYAMNQEAKMNSEPDALLMRRTAELWAGLRRVYFGEVEDPSDSEDTAPSAKKPRTQQTVRDFKREIVETRARIRKLDPRVPADLDASNPFVPRKHDDDHEDGAPPSIPILPSRSSDTSRDEGFDEDLSSASSNGEDDDVLEDDERSKSGEELAGRFSRNLHLEPTNENPLALEDDERSKSGEELAGRFSRNLHLEPTNENPLPKDLVSVQIDEIGELANKNSDPGSVQIKENIAGPISLMRFVGRKILLSSKTMRRILNFKESVMKYGVFVPRNDAEADTSPEHLRWESGRMLEWMRLQKQGTFGRNWDWNRVQKSFPNYKKGDVGHVFFVYDYKHSGEHRVRLVFDGSRQNPETYTDTYAPTARGESVRLFHIFSVEEQWEIAQYDVPQAFLKSVIDCDIFVYPPRGFSEFPGQMLKLQLSLYGAKQSAALWHNMIDLFLQKLGFVSSPMDPCLYKRSDALIILFVDDLRVAATPPVLAEIHAALYQEYPITTSDGTRFLGMDTLYDIQKGYMTLHMETYIVSIHERFHSFDLSCGVPFREVVGCLLWVCLCVMGPELLRVKDLARRSNSYTEDDFKDALKVLDRIYARRTHGIVIVR